MTGTGYVGERCSFWCCPGCSAGSGTFNCFVSDCVDPAGFDSPIPTTRIDTVTDSGVGGAAGDGGSRSGYDGHFTGACDSVGALYSCTCGGCEGFPDEGSDIPRVKFQCWDEAWAWASNGELVPREPLQWFCFYSPAWTFKLY